jgi:hypothetical protein
MPSKAKIMVLALDAADPGLVLELDRAGERRVPAWARRQDPALPGLGAPPGSRPARPALAGFRAPGLARRPRGCR